MTINTDITKKEAIREKNIAVYMNMVSMSPPLELHAALIRDLLSRDNQITVYLLNQSFRSPTDNPFNRRSIYQFGHFRALEALKGLDVTIRDLELKGQSATIPESKLATLELGVMSSLASATKAQSYEQLNPKWQRVYRRMLDSAKKTYNFFKQEIATEHYDYVFMFNGRFGCVKPVLEAARDSQVGFGLVEVKKTINEIVFINELVHSIEGNTRRAFEFYETNPEQAKEVAATFYNKKTKHEATGDPVYTSVQDKGLLPDVYQNTKKKLVVVYPTTEDEYKFIGKEWDGHVPESQVDEIELMANTLPEDEYLIVVKMHPNQATTAENTQKRYEELRERFPHVLVEPPLSKVDTYALMFRADVVVTFASTIGVEATYAGKPSVLIGDTNWGKMDVAHQTYTGTEAGEVIMRNPEPKPKHGAIVWGYYLSEYKDRLPSYERAGNGEYLIDGKKIGHSTSKRILQLPAKLEIEVSKPGFKPGKVFFERLSRVASNIASGKWSIS